MSFEEIKVNWCERILVDIQKIRVLPSVLVKQFGVVIQGLP